jgi:transcriptional regulator with XRE-family HTH domain
LSQADVAVRARVSQSTVSKIERGRSGSLSLEVVAAAASALEADVQLQVRWRGCQLDRLLDARHSRLVGLVCAALVDRGWSVEVEYTFNHYGDRGSVDVIAWRADRAVLLVIEVKTRIVDVQDLLASMHKKRRVVPLVWRSERKWGPAVVGSILVLPDATVHRSVVARHSTIFDLSLPHRTRDVSRWLARPDTALSAIWFVRDSPVLTRRGDFAGELRLKRKKRDLASGGSGAGGTS